MELRRQARGRVIATERERPGAVELLLDLQGKRCRALAYPALTGPVAAGDEVLVNTTAVELGLGTGGIHFVMANLSRQPAPGPAVGHIMKLRYSPVQTNVMSVEEEGSPHRQAIEGFRPPLALPVISGTLHSMVAPAAAGVKAALGMKATVVYIMTDSSALLLPLSRSLQELREIGLVDMSITCGQAIGGDLEAVNVFTALIAAKTVARADVAVVTPGPGHVGTGTHYGFSSVDIASAIDAVSVLGGLPIYIPRLSFADPRERHHGVSHHSITLLSELVHSCAVVAAPETADTGEREHVARQLEACCGPRGHEIRWRDGSAALGLLSAYGVSVSSMGRAIDDDPVFFLAAGAAGLVAAEETRTRARVRSEAR